MMFRGSGGGGVGISEAAVLKRGISREEGFPLPGAPNPLRRTLRFEEILKAVANEGELQVLCSEICKSTLQGRLTGKEDTFGHLFTGMGLKPVSQEVLGFLLGFTPRPPPPLLRILQSRGCQEPKKALQAAPSSHGLGKGTSCPRSLIAAQ